MAQPSALAFARDARLFVWLLGFGLCLCLCSAGCRQAVCSEPGSCLALDISAEKSFPAPAELEVVLLGKTCNVLGVYKPSNRVDLTPSGLVEVRLDGNELPSILRNDGLRVVVTAWPSGGELPWSSATVVPQSEMPVVRVSPQLHPPRMELQPLGNSFPVANVDHLVAVTDKNENQFISFLRPTEFGLIRMKNNLDFDQLIKKTGLVNKLTHITGTVIGGESRVSFIEEDISNVLRIAKSDLPSALDCDVGKAIILDSNRSWGSIINTSLTQNAEHLLLIPDMSSSIHLGSLDSCLTGVTLGESIVINLNSGPIFSDVYPKSGITKQVAVIADDSLRVITLNGQAIEKNLTLSLSTQDLKQNDIIFLAFVDMKLDFQPKIVIGTNTAELLVFSQQGNELKMTGRQRINEELKDITDIRLGDFNGDTWVDAATLSTLIAGSKMRIWLGDGFGKFIEGTAIDGSIRAMDAADLNAGDQGRDCADELIVATDTSISIFSAKP